MREIRFDGRAAVVTGAGAGLGRCHALLLAARGAAVLVNDADPSRAESVAAEIVSVGGTALADSTDVATVAGGEKIIQTAADACLAESIARVGKLSDPILAAVEKSETTRMKELFHDLGLAGAGGRVM